jgi:hypothetical protein
MATRLKIYVGQDNITKKFESWQQIAIEETILKYFDGFSIYKADGFYQGKREDSRIIEVLLWDDSPYSLDIKAILKQLKEQTLQEEILYTLEPINMGLV